MPNLSCYQSKNIDLTLYKSGPYCISTSFWTKRAKTCSVLMSWNSLIKMAIYVRLSYRTTWYCSKLYKVSERCQMLVKRLSNYDFIFCAHRSTVSDDTTGCNVMKKKKTLLSSASATVYYYVTEMYVQPRRSVFTTSLSRKDILDCNCCLLVRFSDSYSRGKALVLSTSRQSQARGTPRCFHYFHEGSVAWDF